MYFPPWVPGSFQPLLAFILNLGLLSLFYSGVISNLASLFGIFTSSIRIRGDTETLARVTVGHSFLTAMTSLVLVSAVQAEPERLLPYFILAGLFLWTTMTAEFYEDLRISKDNEEKHSRLVFIERLFLIVLWMVELAILFHGNFHSLVAPLIPVGQFVTSIAAIPYFLGPMLSLSGLLFLLWSFFAGMNATFRLPWEFRVAFPKRHELPGEWKK